MFLYDGIWIYALLFYVIPCIQVYSEWKTQWVYDPEALVIFFFTVGLVLTIYTFVWGLFLVFDR